MDWKGSRRGGPPPGPSSSTSWWHPLEHASRAGLSQARHSDPSADDFKLRKEGWSFAPIHRHFAALRTVGICIAGSVRRCVTERLRLGFVSSASSWAESDRKPSVCRFHPRRAVGSQSPSVPPQDAPCPGPLCLPTYGAGTAAPGPAQGPGSTAVHTYEATSMLQR